MEYAQKTPSLTGCVRVCARSRSARSFRRICPAMMVGSNSSARSGWLNSRQTGGFASNPQNFKTVDKYVQIVFVCVYTTSMIHLTALGGTMLLLLVYLTMFLVSVNDGCVK